MIRAQASQSIGAQMVSATDGSAFTGTVTIYITGDAGTQAIGSVSSGLCTHEGNGYHTYRPSAAETDYDLIAFTFIGTGAIPATIQVATVTEGQQTALSAAAPTGVLTASDLCLRIAIRLGVVQAGEVLAPEDQQLILDTLNTYVDGMGTESLTMFDVSRATFDLDSGTASYFVGPGSDIDIIRPVSSQAIDRVAFIDPINSPTLERALYPLTPQAYEGIPIKTQESPYPSLWYYNPTHGPAGLGTLTVWPVQNQALTGVIYTAQAVAQLALGTTITLPPGYRRFLETNIAVEVAPAFTATVSPELRAAAMESRANIKRVNSRLMDLTIDPALTGRSRHTYSIWSDT